MPNVIQDVVFFNRSSNAGDNTGDISWKAGKMAMNRVENNHYLFGKMVIMVMIIDPQKLLSLVKVK